MGNTHALLSSPQSLLSRASFAFVLPPSWANSLLGEKTLSAGLAAASVSEVVLEEHFGDRWRLGMSLSAINQQGRDLVMGGTWWSQRGLEEAPPGNEHSPVYVEVNREAGTRVFEIPQPGCVTFLFGSRVETLLLMLVPVSELELELGLLSGL